MLSYKKITTVLLCLLTLQAMSKSGENSIKQGLYRGSSWSVTPQPFVYVMIKNDSAFVDCFYPFKGQCSYLFRDTLTRVHHKNIVFSSEKNHIYEKKGHYFFKCPFQEQIYHFNDLKLQYRPTDIHRYHELREPYNYENNL